MTGRRVLVVGSGRPGTSPASSSAISASSSGPRPIEVNGTPMLLNGIQMPYAKRVTTTWSPMSSVGTIEPDGMR